MGGALKAVSKLAGPIMSMASMFTPLGPIMQMAKMASVAPVGDGHIYVFGVVVAAAAAGACLVIAGMMARRSGA